MNGNIVIKDLCKSFGNKVIFDSFSYVFPSVGISVLKGASGRGKTTLLRIIAGLEKDFKGEVSFPPKTRVSYMFQEDRLLPWLTARENVEFVCGDREKSERLLVSLGLGDELDKKADLLSGGQKRRVAAARALAYDCDVLLLDEPFTGLDPENKEALASLIRERAKDLLVIAVTHSDSDLLGGRIEEI